MATIADRNIFESSNTSFETTLLQYPIKRATIYSKQEQKELKGVRVSPMAVYANCQLFARMDAPFRVSLFLANSNEVLCFDFL